MAGWSRSISALVVILISTPALSHSFYEYRCCSDKDCGPVPFSSVKVTPEGYLVLFPTGRKELIPFGDTRIRDTPPEDPLQQYHLCTVAGRMDGMILCIYVPQGGA